MDDIVNVVSKHVELKKQGVNLIGLCPFHEEDTPSLTVDPKSQTFHCFGCKRNGGIEDFRRLINQGGSQ